MPINRLIKFLFCFGLLLTAGAPLAAVDVVEVADTRILIDVSGSMKNNDPANLRRPALRLLVGLLPDDARAGVWTFGQYVNMQVPLGKVDDAWKIRARQGAGKIHSRGLFTNIEEVLKRSIADWQGATTKYRRHLILLTDGMVDISKSADENAESRQRILDQILPQLKEYDARVHTIALSERADHELMKTLSDETGGWYEQVDDASQLQRIFLRLFEKVGRPDSVPLKENRFTIDSSISETTLLVFRDNAAPPTRVTTPSGKTFGAIDAPENVNWHRDEGYDLLTISGPETGEWQIQASLDPDNRVMVVTDLKLHSTELPNKLALGEQLPLVVHFSDSGKKITAPDFLEVLDIQVEQNDTEGPGEPRPLFDDGQQGDAAAGDGDFTMLVGDRDRAGRVELLLDVEGKTFRREQRQSFTVVPSYRVEVTANSERGESALQVKVFPDMELLDPASISIQGSMSSERNGSQPVMMLPVTGGSGWESVIDRKTLSGSWKLALHLSARTLAGNQLEIDLEPVVIDGLAAEPLADPPPELEEAQTSEGTEPDWIMLASLFGAGNLLLLSIAGVAFWLVRRGSAKDQIQLLGDEDAVDAEGAAG
ncbi:MAG: VWA domain-containing protein [Gammaproteobacteria bacterium]|nr:VWA domain-containing protein [Gammaproteobacteria bacterium]